MSKKFTGVHSGGQNIPVYDKDAHSAIEQKLDTSAFQSVSGNFLTAVPDAYATKDYADAAASSAANAAASGKLDTDTFSQVSGDFLTAVPQSYLQNTDLTVTSGKVTEISGIPLSAGGTLPDTIPVSGVSGISVTETENEVLIGISADFATSSDLEKKLDTSAFSSVSGNFLTAVPENYSTKEYLSEQISGKYDTSSFAAVSGDFLTAVPESAISGKQDASAMSAYQEKGDYYSASNPSGFLTAIPQSALSGYAEYSAISGSIAPSGFAFFTAFRNLFADVSAAVAAGKICYAKSTVESNIYYPLVYFENGDGYYRQHLAVFGTFTCPYDTWDLSGTKKPGYTFYSVNGDLDPTTTNSGWHQNDRSFVIATDLSGYMSTSGLEYDGDKISGYMGSAFKAGDELPESVTDAANYVSATSGDIDATIDNVSSNSGAWGGSALPISAGPGIKVNLVDNTLVFSNDETVLWSGGNLAIGSTATLSETVKNFELFGVYGHETNRGRGVYQQFNPDVVVNANTQNFALFLPDCAPDFTWAGWYIENLYFTDTAATALANVSGRQTWRWYNNNTWEDGGAERYIQVDKIVGINRISGDN